MNYWTERFEELKAHLAATDNPKKKMPNRKTQLGVWCDGQVLEFNKFKSGMKPCYITQERIDMLLAIGFVCDRMQAAWMGSYNALKNFRDENGHCTVGVNYGDKTLFRWIAKQRKKYKNYKDGKKPALTDEQVKLLAEIHFFEPADKRTQNNQPIRDRRSRSKGRPKSTTLIPPEAQGVMNQSNNTNATELPMPQLPPVDDGISSIVQECIDGAERGVQLDENHKPIGEGVQEGVEVELEDGEPDAQMPEIDTPSDDERDDDLTPAEIQI